MYSFLYVTFHTKTERVNFDPARIWWLPYFGSPITHSLSLVNGSVDRKISRTFEILRVKKFIPNAVL